MARERCWRRPWKPIRDRVARPLVVAAERLCHVGKRKLVQRTALDPRLGAVQRRRNPPADGIGETRGLRRSTQIFQLGADRVPRLQRQSVRRRVLFDIGDGIQRGLSIAGAGQHAGEIAGLSPPAAILLLEMRLDQPQEGAPELHRCAEIVHRDRLDALAVLHRRPAFRQNVAGNGPQRFSDRVLRP